MIGQKPICLECKHFTRSKRTIGLHCAAFPDGIPKQVIMGDNDHEKPIEGDHGLQFEPRE